MMDVFVLGHFSGRSIELLREGISNGDAVVSYDDS